MSRRARSGGVGPPQDYPYAIAMGSVDAVARKARFFAPGHIAVSGTVPAPTTAGLHRLSLRLEPTQRRTSFEVRGYPASKGSPKFGRNRRTGARMIIPQSARLTAWSAAVWRAAAATHVRFPVRVPVALAVTFRMPAQRGEVAGQRCVRAADADKLLRATMDALQHAGMVADDAQIAHVSADKFVVQRGTEGATVTVWRLGA